MRIHKNLLIYFLTIFILFVAISIRLNTLSHDIEFFGPDDVRYLTKVVYLSNTIKDNFYKQPIFVALVNSLSSYTRIHCEAKPAFIFQLGIWNLLFNPQSEIRSYYSASFNIFLFTISLVLFFAIGIILCEPMFGFLAVLFWGLSTTAYLHCFWGLEKMAGSTWILIAIFFFILSKKTVVRHYLLSDQLLCGFSLFVALFSSYSTIPLIVALLLLLSNFESILVFLRREKNNSDFMLKII